MSTPTLLKTTAICLNIRPFSKTSHMVTWLSEAYGRITTPIKGAMRPKSQFLGKYDIGVTCELVIYAHESHGGIHNIRECMPLILRADLRAGWRAAVAASYACDLTMRIAQPGLPAFSQVDTLSALLDSLSDCTEREIPLALLWFESNLLCDVGVAPDFIRCPRCPSAPRHTFSVEEGRFLCEHRPSRLNRPVTVMLHNDIPDLFALFRHTPLSDILQLARASDRKDDLGRPEPFPGIFGLRRFLGLFLGSHLDMLPGPRRTVLDMLV